jgi:hypothetical protein
MRGAARAERSPAGGEMSTGSLPQTLGLPVACRGRAWAAAAILGLAYVLTMQRDLGLFDSAELAMVAQQRGLGHPTGQPLHTLIGWVFAGIPGVPPLVGLNLLSAIPAALCAVPIASLATPLDRDVQANATFTALVTLIFGWHATVWEPATRVEVYALAAFLTLFALARLRFVTESRGGLFPVGLAFGLAASVNPFMAVAGAVAGSGWLWRRIQAGPRQLSSVAGLVGGGLLGLAPYLHVFAVADRTDVFVWEGDDLARYFSGLDYAHNRGLGPAEVAARAVAWLRGTLENGQAVLWLAGAAAAGYVQRSYLFAVVTTLGATVYVLSINRIFYVDNPDYLGYLLVPGGLAAGALATLGHVRPRLARLLAAALALSALLVAPAPWLRARDTDRVPRVVAEGILAELPTDAIVLVGSDHLAFPLLYIQRVEGQRPDVVILVDGLLDSSWYWRLTHAWHPKLVPVPLAGPHVDRVRRFLDAQPERHLHVETGALAGMVGRRMCAGAFLLQSVCEADASIRIAGATRTLGTLADATAWGAPHAANVLAAIGWHRGEALWRLGHPDLALDALLAALPGANRPVVTEPVRDVAALRGPAPEFSTPVILGHPGRNLFFAARLLSEAGRTNEAVDALNRAADLGLVEAMR